MELRVFSSAHRLLKTREDVDSFLKKYPSVADFVDGIRHIETEFGEKYAIYIRVDADEFAELLEEISCPVTLHTINGPAGPIIDKYYRGSYIFIWD
jgi:hypothetical protein